MTGPIIEKLPETSDPPTYYRIVVTRLGLPWLNANDRLHWNTRARLVRTWRTRGSWQLRTLPRMDAARIICELRLSKRTRRDPSNWAPTAKALVDGMVDADILPDDDSTRVIGPDLRRGPTVALPADEAIVMHIWPIPRQEQL